MYKIYRIVNKINHKIYVGQTSKTIEERFEEHIYNSKCSDINHRKLYMAIQKYGIKNFYVEEIDRAVTKEDANYKEEFYIECYNSFHKGYNANTGGDCGSANRKRVFQIDKSTLNIINTFNSTREAGRDIGKPNIHISDACLGKRKSAYGYYWCFAEDYDKYLCLLNSNDYTPNKNRIYTRTILQIDSEGTILTEYDTVYDAARSIKGCPTKIREVCKGKRKHHRGYKWEYKFGPVKASTG